MTDSALELGGGRAVELSAGPRADEPAHAETNNQGEFRRFMIGGGRSLTIEGKGSWSLFVGSGISWL